MSAKILGTQYEFNQMVLTPLLMQINARIRAQSGHILNKTRAALSAELWASDEIQELASPGKLSAILGLERGSEYPRTSAIVDKVVSQTELIIEPFRYVSGIIRGSITINILPTDYRELLSIPEATLNATDWEFPFLRWLLLEGDRIIIPEYGTLYIPAHDFAGSRSGPAIQIKSQHANLIFRVPPRWSGVREDNLLTRSIRSESFGQSLLDIIFSSII